MNSKELAGKLPYSCYIRLLDFVELTAAEIKPNETYMQPIS